METFVWLEDLTTGRVEWRYSGMEHGELSVTQTGVPLKLKLCVNNWDSLQMVRLTVICIIKFSVGTKLVL